MITSEFDRQPGVSQYFTILTFSFSRETATCSEMIADRATIYDESTDEEGESLPDPSVSAPGNKYIYFLF